MALVGTGPIGKWSRWAIVGWLYYTPSTWCINHKSQQQNGKVQRKHSNWCGQVGIEFMLNRGTSLSPEDLILIDKTLTVGRNHQWHLQTKESSARVPQGKIFNVSHHGKPKNKWLLRNNHNCGPLSPIIASIFGQSIQRHFSKDRYSSAHLIDVLYLKTNP